MQKRPVPVQARSAVTNEPLRNAASITSTPLLSPLMIRFLRGKCCGSGGVESGNSETTAPPVAIKFSASTACRRG